MPSVTVTIADTPSGGISIRSDYQPAVGNPCSRAQSAALDMIRRTRKEFGLPDDVDIDQVHRSRDNVVGAAQS